MVGIYRDILMICTTLIKYHKAETENINPQIYTQKRTGELIENQNGMEMKPIAKKIGIMSHILVANMSNMIDGSFLFLKLRSERYGFANKLQKG